MQRHWSDILHVIPHFLATALYNSLLDLLSITSLISCNCCSVVFKQIFSCEFQTPSELFSTSESSDSQRFVSMPTLFDDADSPSSCSIFKK